MALAAVAGGLLISCSGQTPKAFAPKSAAQEPAPQRDPGAETGEASTLPAAIESPTTATITGRLIDLDPAVRWACSYSGMVVESVEKPSDTLRIYRITDARNTPMRIEFACDDFTRGHFAIKPIGAEAAFGRFADERRQNQLLVKIQQRMNQLAKRTR